ncbi:hypothetical protein BCD_1597 (plasmid) [Borrelia crocidurae DOU]|uniref:Uncharacterized protein n=1 Tax=Borrelia crocidurae DOU TaxID=1293575 RepID=W5SLU7_9SPIR|nr:hypothetical protein BCD_1597 [Borrelia crocidurae DOU]
MYDFIQQNEYFSPKHFNETKNNIKYTKNISILKNTKQKIPRA